jgi:hypothetical protein
MNNIVLSKEEEEMVKVLIKIRDICLEFIPSLNIGRMDSEAYKSLKSKLGMD